MADIKGFIKKQVLFFLPLYHSIIVRRLRKKKQINVLFFAMSLSMWRYQNIYELLSRHPKFKVFIVIQSSITYSAEQQNEDIGKLMSFFEDKGMPFFLGQDNNGEAIDIRKLISPDILFYPQPYTKYYPEALRYNRFYDKLLCYYPYAFWMSKGEWSYNQPLHKTAWKLLYPTNLHKKDAETYSIRKGKNMEVVGYPTSDEFLADHFTDIWKPQEKQKKRVIWAPHFTIFSEEYVTQSNFIWMAEFMVDLCERYSDKIQIVFKPHPRLLSELCRHDDWGKEKAMAYYHKWETMANSQIESGDFVDLFMTSDAMIHDSGSFCVEYHYSGNPVMYIAQDFEEQVAEKNELGEKAMCCHYIGKTKEDVIDFIENVVLHGSDPMKVERQNFRKEYLLPPNGKTVAENTMDVLLKAFC